MRACSHHWINPADAPIARRPFAPMLGAGRRQMKPGAVYRCTECGAELRVPAAPGAVTASFERALGTLERWKDAPIDAAGRRRVRDLLGKYEA